MNGALERFIRQATVDDYARVRAGGATDDRSHRWLYGFAVAIVSAVLVILLVAAVGTVRATGESREGARAVLAQKVLDVESLVTRQQNDVDDLMVQVSALRESLNVDTASEASESELAALSAAAGVSALSGPGVTVVIDDAPDAEAGSLNRVLDRDLQDIVNALWQMGASGIAVNDQRLTQSTAIRGAGEAILVNYRPLQRPYTVSAVGTQSTAAGADDLDALLDLLSREYGLVSQVTTGDVTLPEGQVHDPITVETVEGAS